MFDLRQAKRTMKRAFLFCLLLPLYALQAAEGPTAQVGSISGRSSQTTQIPPPQEAPSGGDFTLQSAAGPVSLQDFRGKVVLLFFGYASCPDVCPNALSYMVQALDGLSEKELARVQGLFVSVDPRRDTPTELADYVAYFHPNLVGVTGTEEEVAQVAALYGAQYYEAELEGSPLGYVVNHSSVTYLITQDGALRFIFPHGTPPSVVLEAVQYVLNGN
jgi:protein SCO1/2